MSSADTRASRLDVARIIALASLGFALLGVALPVALWTPMFAIYRDQIAGGVGIESLDSHARLLMLVGGITGGSIAGKWAVHMAIARYGLTRNERWARDATAAGLATWFLVDGAGSLSVGAWWNPVLINGMPLAFVGLPLVLRWRALGADTRAPGTHASMDGPARAVLVTSILGVVTGLVIALGGGSPLFDLWFAGLAEAGFVTADAATSRAIALTFFGPIGGCVSAQFAMVALIARGPMREGARWAAPACAASLLAWFLVDSTYGVLSGGHFNVLMINIPTLALSLPPLAWAHARARSIAQG